MKTDLDILAEQVDIDRIEEQEVEHGLDHDTSASDNPAE